LVAQIKCSPEWSHFGSSTYPHLFQNATKLKKRETSTRDESRNCIAACRGEGRFYLR
jgi:hypothetical protein